MLPDKVLSKGRRNLPVLQPGSKQLLIRVHACSVTPGDYRMITGIAKFLKKPRDGFPYIPGLDVSGTVVESSVEDFTAGDEVISTWFICGEGGMAEYALVDAVRTIKRSSNVSAVDGAALANSASHALNAVREAGVKEGSRVLVLGGTGGVGQAVIQISRAFGASFIAATGTQTDLLRCIGVDVAIDYSKQHWGSETADIGVVDAVIDCAEGVAAWTHASLTRVLKRSGRFVARAGKNPIAIELLVSIQ